MNHSTVRGGPPRAEQKRGRPRLARGFVAGTLATVALTLLSPLVVDVALKFGPAEYFAVMVLAFMLFLPGVTDFLPESVLAAVVIVAISSVFQPTGVPPRWTSARHSMARWASAATAAGTG